MRKILLVFFALMVAGLLGGCATTKPPLYYYGTYPRTLYKAKKDPSAENAAKHQASIEDIIKVSSAKKLRVPPGIYCEYGYLLWQKGQTVEAEIQFGLEVTTYPESATFVALLIKTLKHEPTT